MNCAWLMNTQESGLFSVTVTLSPVRCSPVMSITSGALGVVEARFKYMVPSMTMETGAATPPTCELPTKSLTSFTIAAGEIEVDRRIGGEPAGFSYKSPPLAHVEDHVYGCVKKLLFRPGKCPTAYGTAGKPKAERTERHRPSAGRTRARRPVLLTNWSLSPVQFFSCLSSARARLR